MSDVVNELLDTAWRAIRLVAENAVSVDVPLLALGVLLYLAQSAIRTRGWFTILRAAFPEATGLRARDVCFAYLAGAGLNGVIPARGGDVVKLALLRRRIEGARYSTLAATFVPETTFETLFGTGLVVWALAKGFLPVPTASGEIPALDVSLFIEHPFIATAATVAVLTLGTLLFRWVRRRADDLIDRLRQGMRIFASPRDFIVGVAGWQALARVVRLGSLAALMGAFALPVTPTTVVLVMAAQGGGRIIPLAPASAGLRLAMLSYGFIEVTGQAVDIAKITTFTVGVGLILMVAGLIVSLAILAREFGTLNPRHAVAAARAAVAERGPWREPKAETPT